MHAQLKGLLFIACFSFPRYNFHVSIHHNDFLLDLRHCNFFFFISIQEVGSLVRETRVEDWDVFTCINCNMDTHALHVVKKYDRVLINKGLEV